jgi:hypothetical protein
MGHFAGVVLGKSDRDVVSDARVKMLRIETFENINELHCRSAFALRATARQPSLASLQESPAWLAEP